MVNGKFPLGTGDYPTVQDKGKPMKTLVSKFLRDEAGATAIEYGLIAAGIALAIISVVNGLGTTLSGKFDSINNSLK
jgi:pilus assembly protein Flp/PilA